MTPQTVNAVNLPLQNALNFPAAILQPPYFDADADAAAQLRRDGRDHRPRDQPQLRRPGQPVRRRRAASPTGGRKDDFDHFKAAGEALAAQFDAYRPFPDLAVNGHQTLSENIADVAGLLAAYDAYRLSLRREARRVKDGFTGDQQFFISFGQSWRSQDARAALRSEIATDGHAPDQYRADTVRNLDAWYDAFAVQPAQKLYLAPKDRVRVW